MFRLLAIISLFIFFGKNTSAQYSIKGKVNLSENWQSKIYMAQITKLSDYYRTSSDMIIGKADVEEDGTFVLEGESLPSETHFYRLYLMKTQNTDYDACLYVGGDDHNFAHIVLKDGESLEIVADPISNAPFGKYEIIGNQANILMDTLSSIIFPSFYFYRLTFPTELKNAENQLQKNLKNFADTCSNTLVALAAVNWAKWLMIGLGALSLILAFQLFQSKNRIKNLESQLAKVDSKPTVPSISLEEILTQKEKEILLLISEGKSNKEIASSLFVELSTVKSHINKIYSKIGASNRKEAQSIARKQFQ